MGSGFEHRMQGQQQGISTLGSSVPDPIKAQGSQLVNSTLPNWCHTGRSNQSVMCKELGPASNDCEVYGGYHADCFSEWAIHKELGAARSDCKAVSPSSARRDTNSPSDSEERSTATTLNIESTPSHYNASAWQEELDSAGFQGEYDFLSLQSLGRRIGCKGAIVNFGSPVVVNKFRSMFHHSRLQLSGPNDAALTVVIAPVHGLAACALGIPEGWSTEILAAACHHNTQQRMPHPSVHGGGDAREDCDVHDGCYSGRCSETAMHKELGVARSDCEASLYTSTRTDTNSSLARITANAQHHELDLVGFVDKYDSLNMPSLGRCIG